MLHSQVMDIVRGREKTLTILGPVAVSRSVGNKAWLGSLSSPSLTLLGALAGGGGLPSCC